MTAPTLTDFLLARVTEDEAVARNVLSASDQFDWDDDPAPHLVDPRHAFGLAGPVDGPSGYASMIVNPARVLAECQAKRRIVEMHAPLTAGGQCRTCSLYIGPEDLGQDWPCPTVGHLATVYADHPDYNQSWRP